MPPRQNPGKSRQDYRTPGPFLSATARRFGPIAFDLACSTSNRVAPSGFTAADDALSQDWCDLRIGRGSVAWCNPPFGNIAPWAEKCVSVRHLQRWTLLLVPLGTQDWACRYVWGQAYVLKLRGRLTFGGESSPYPKDLMLAAYGFGVVGEEAWDWRQEASHG
jgi:hypothetical protein